jgi:hypothetical protein
MRETGVSALADDGIPVPFEFTRALLRGIGIKARMPWTEGERRLNLAADRIVVWTLEEIAKVAGKHGAVPVFLGLDNVVDPPAAEVRALRDAESAGFLVFDLFDLWQGHDKEALRIAPWDNHPNAAGSRVIAERLVALIQENRARLRLDR